MNQPYALPTATVLSATLVLDVATVSVVLSEENYLRYPIAPANLRMDTPFHIVFPFHQLIGRDGQRLTFETYSPEAPLPVVGSVYTFCSWFLPSSFDALLDTSAIWTLCTYPDDGDHDHCLFTWDTISADGGEFNAYRSVHGWITIVAYQKFIEQDILRIRTHPRSIEVAV